MGKQKKVSLEMELSKEEIERIFAYFDEGIDDWMEFHQKNEGSYELDFGIKARFENALYMVTSVDE